MKSSARRSTPASRYTPEVTTENSRSTASFTWRIWTPGLPGSAISTSALGTTARGGTRKPGERPVMVPFFIANSASTTHDGANPSAGKVAENVTASLDSAISRVPDWRLAIGLPKSWPTSRSIRREVSAMAYRKAPGAMRSFLTDPRSETVPKLPYGKRPTIC